VGNTVAENTLLLQVHGAKEALAEKDLRRAIHLEFERTSEQDPNIPFACSSTSPWALSPAINDPTTAVQAIDQIDDLLRRLGRRDLDAGHAGIAKRSASRLSDADMGGLSDVGVR
jgi:uncharacterized membrane protein